MINVNVEFEVKVNIGKYKDKIVYILTSIEELEEEDLSTLLINGGFLEYWCNNNEYVVINRNIIL